MKKTTDSRVLLPPFAVCVIMDLIGYASFAVPGMGEFSDIVWAPLSALIFYKLFGGGKMGLFGGFFNFLEEILPFTDFIPTFTIAWFIRNKAIEKSLNDEGKIADTEATLL